MRITLPVYKLHQCATNSQKTTYAAYEEQQKYDTKGAWWCTTL